VQTYARMLHDLATRRGLISVCQETITSAFAAATDEGSDGFIEAHEAQLLALVRERERADAAIAMNDALDVAIDDINRAMQNGNQLLGLPTGLHRLDNALGGLQKSDLIVLGGRPGSGKTALATNIAHRVAQGGYSVLFFSQEMSAAQIVARILGGEAGVSAEKLRRGKGTMEDAEKAIRAADGLRDLPLIFDETGGLTIGQIVARARRHKRKSDIDLIIIDYIQLMRGSDRKRDQNRTQEVTEITIGLKALAKELQVPILALSQLSRRVEERSDKRPMLSDLRESGSVEQDADVVMFVYREEYYVGQREPDLMIDPVAHTEWQRQMRACQGKAEIILGKNRHGETANLLVNFDASRTRFSDGE
jgi:replicative DNA helicase